MEHVTTEIMQRQLQRNFDRVEALLRETSRTGYDHRKLEFYAEWEARSAQIRRIHRFNDMLLNGLGLPGGF
jgi:two-component sensor histidine kinase